MVFWDLWPLEDQTLVRLHRTGLEGGFRVEKLEAGGPLEPVCDLKAFGVTADGLLSLE